MSRRTLGPYLYLGVIIMANTIKHVELGLAASMTLDHMDCNPVLHSNEVSSLFWSMVAMFSLFCLFWS
jgi:hypothetical protein